jgi:drug/metabolite transporter (DMT)-like permease
MRPNANAQGIAAAFLTPIFLGMAPIFGKLAINAGADSFTVAAWRTVIAVAFLWILYLLFARKYIFIYPAGLLGCVVVGIVNGIGSLFYYGGLGLLDASLAQLLNGMYLIFVVLLSRMGGERLDTRMIIRILLAVVALVILTGFGSKPIVWLGVGLMLANALMFAGTVILSQYVLFEMPSPTVTLYTLSTMGVLVAMVWLAVGKPMSPEVLSHALPPIMILAVTTAASRLSLFAGVKFLGSLQTAVLALTEIGVALTLAFFVLGDRLTPAQLMGVAILGVSILLVRAKDILPRGINPNRLVSNLADLQYMWIAFDQAFGKTPHEDDSRITTPKLTTTEMSAIRRMMGVESGPIAPITVNKEDYTHLPSMEGNEVSPDVKPKKRPTKQDRAE